MNGPVREKLVLPNGGDRLLMHSCCAPCSGELMEAFVESGIDYTIFFYNPNIHPSGGNGSSWKQHAHSASSWIAFNRAQADSLRRIPASASTHAYRQ